jgi:hypothetical protein
MHCVSVKSPFEDFFFLNIEKPSTVSDNAVDGFPSFAFSAVSAIVCFLLADPPLTVLAAKQNLLMSRLASCFFFNRSFVIQMSCQSIRSSDLYLSMGFIRKLLTEKQTFNITD